MLGLSLTLARVCVESSDLDGALLGMTKAAEYIERLKETENTTKEDEDRIRKIEAEYFSMRCALVSAELYAQRLANLSSHGNKVVWMLPNTCTQKPILF